MYDVLMLNEKQTKDNNKIASPWLTKQELADYYKCSIRHITNLKRKRIIPYCKALRRYNINFCDKAMDKFTVKAVGEYQSFSA